MLYTINLIEKYNYPLGHIQLGTYKTNRHNLTNLIQFVRLKNICRTRH